MWSSYCFYDLHGLLSGLLFLEKCSFRLVIASVRINLKNNDLTNIYRSEAFELKGWPLVVGHGVVFASSDNPERSRRTEVAAVDRPRLPWNVTVAGSSVGQEHVAEFLSALADDNNPLVVLRPRNIVDRTRDRLILGF